MKKLNDFPFHTLLFAIFPTISLMGHNIGQISLIYIARPLVVSIILTILLLLLVYIFIKDWTKTGLIVTPMIIVFSMYGIIFDLIQDKTLLGYRLNHRFVLLFLLGLVIGAIAFFVIRRKGSLKLANQFVTIIGLAAVLIPVYQIVSHQLSNSTEPATAEVGGQITQPDITRGQSAPDIYHFVLDSYSRSDLLESAFKIDNSAFIEELRQLGFYVADCSWPNYVNTRLSLSTTLNMDYIDVIAPDATPKVQNMGVVDPLILHSKVRADLEAIGYKTVSFQTGYLFTEFHDADYYIPMASFSFFRPFVTPFESLLLDETAFRLLKLIPAVRTWSIQSPLYEKYLIDKNKVELLENLDIPSPKFVFAHFAAAHRPFMFTADGELQGDDRYYSKTNSRPINPEFGTKGYANGIAYLNTSMINIFKKLLASDTPPIIIIQGDHGNVRLQQQGILNAYYFPDQDYHSLYPNITPVNSYRLIFNQFFNGSMPLLPDRSYYSELNYDPFIFNEVFEESPACLNK